MLLVLYKDENVSSDEPESRNASSELVKLSHFDNGCPVMLLCCLVEEMQFWTSSSPAAWATYSTTSKPLVSWVGIAQSYSVVCIFWRKCASRETLRKLWRNLIESGSLNSARLMVLCLQITPNLHACLTTPCLKTSPIVLNVCAHWSNAPPLIQFKVDDVRTKEDIFKTDDEISQPFPFPLTFF